VGDDIRKYHLSFRDRYLIFARQGIQIDDYPAIESHLAKFKNKLVPKPKDWRGAKWQGRKSGKYKWYEIQDKIDYYKELEKPKIVFPDIAKDSRFAHDNMGFYLANTAYLIPIDDKFLLGILNSRLIFAYFRRTASVLGDADRGGRMRGIRQDVINIPIRMIDNKNPGANNLRDQMVILVESILALHNQLEEVKSDAQRLIIKRQIDSADQEINRLVYELYDLMEEEIAIVEG